MTDKHCPIEEESSVKEGEGVDDSHNNEKEKGYYSDDYIVTYAGGRKMSRKHREEYMRQINESEGFDITLDLELNAALGGPVVPLRGDFYKPLCTELSHMAIHKFNKENALNYEFVEIVNMTAQLGGGVWYYITFNAKDADAAIKTFQALGWQGVSGDLEVSFCRFKKSSSHEGDTKSPNSDVGTQCTCHLLKPLYYCWLLLKTGVIYLCYY
ncbi:multicystatin-like [Solanum tuberosum]|uniref:Cystatin domain-containing protein n=1 Tax=Solanum tuberosum TaxID=4113 RepID=M1AKB9_SOLTU|nr:PREDICTED: multicystatin-like [Solanum tuberosum]